MTSLKPTITTSFLLIIILDFFLSTTLCISIENQSSYNFFINKKFDHNRLLSDYNEDNSSDDDETVPIDRTTCDSSLIRGGDTCCYDYMFYNNIYELCYRCSMYYHHYCNECNSDHCLNCSSDDEYDGTRCKEGGVKVWVPIVISILVLIIICLIAAYFIIKRKKNKILREKNQIEQTQQINISNNNDNNKDITIKDNANIKNNEDYVSNRTNNNDICVVDDNINKYEKTPSSELENHPAVEGIKEAPNKDIIALKDNEDMNIDQK